jgi:hypothetical protein
MRRIAVKCDGRDHHLEVRKCQEGPGIEFVVLDHDMEMITAFAEFGAEKPACVAIAEALDGLLDLYIKADAFTSGWHGEKAREHWSSQTAFLDARAAAERAFERLKEGDWPQARTEFSVAAAIEYRFGYPGRGWWQKLNDHVVLIEWAMRQADEPT